MSEWLDAIAGSGLASALAWTIGALLLLLVVLVLIKIVRGLTFGTFVAGGRNRKARLAVMDAAAVDSQRRLVLVRRDDVEHLLLIGGGADIVVEQNIRLVPHASRNGHEDQRLPESAVVSEDRERAHRIVAAAQAEQRAATPDRTARAAAPQAEPQRRPQPAPSQSAALPAAPVPLRPAPVRPPVAAAAPAVSQPVVSGEGTRAAPPLEANRQQPSPTVPDIDDSLMEELEVTLERQMQRPDAIHQPVVSPAPVRVDPPVSNAPADRSVSIEDEMSRLLGELSGRKS